MKADEEIALAAHARWQAARRGLAEEEILRVARAPQQVIRLRRGREIRQSRGRTPQGGEHLLRVVVEVTTEGATVVTAYRTSKTRKYWRGE